jgi:hypothetical protein
VFVQKISRQCSKVGRNHHEMFVKHKIILFGVMALSLATSELYLYILKAVEAAACTNVQQVLHGKVNFFMENIETSRYLYPKDKYLKVLSLFTAKNAHLSIHHCVLRIEVSKLLCTMYMYVRKPGETFV